jgi:hypothetical protein
MMRIDQAHRQGLASRPLSFTLQSINEQLMVKITARQKRGG